MRGVKGFNVEEDRRHERRSLTDAELGRSRRPGVARHAKPQTTLNHYAKVSVRDLRDAVESLPAPTHEPEDADLAATGTHGQHIDKRFAPPLRHAGDGPRPNGTDTGGSTVTASAKSNTPEPPMDAGFGRVLSVPDGS
jgi:hypothetical protein